VAGVLFACNWLNIKFRLSIVFFVSGKGTSITRLKNTRKSPSGNDKPCQNAFGKNWQGFPRLEVRPCEDWNWIWLLLVLCVSSLVTLPFNNESKFYSYSFVLVPELLKEHSPLSTLFELLFIDCRTNIKTYSKDLRCCLKLKLETSIKTRTSVSRRFYYTDFSLLLRRMGKNSCFENCTP